MLGLSGKFGWEISDGDVLLARQYFHNGITEGGVHDLLDLYFRNGSTAAAWYFGVIDSDSFSALADATDTMASHAGWVEFTGYDEATRQAWSPDAASSQTITNSTLPSITINTAGTLKGLFMTTDSTKSGTSGILWNSGIPSVTQSVQPGNSIKLFYELLAQEG